MPHGTRARYRRLDCRCLPCRGAQAEYLRALKRRPPLLDAAPARVWLNALRGHGVGITQVARLAGVNRALVANVRAGVRRKLSAEILYRLLSVPPVYAPGRTVLSGPTKRLIRKLLKEGYTRRQIAERLGLKSGRLRHLSKARRVRRKTAARVRALYARLTAVEDRRLAAARHEREAGGHAPEDHDPEYGAAAVDRPDQNAERGVRDRYQRSA